jgi:glycosyltransferase involved in cell wall biosynthesis
VSGGSDAGGLAVDVLQIISSTDPRGAEVFALSLERALRPHLSVNTVALAPGSSGGLDVEILGRRRLGIETLVSLRRRLRTAGVVVAHGSTTLPACSLAGAGLHRPIVYRNIGDPLQWSNTGLRRIRTRFLLSRMHRVVALTPGVADTLTGRLGVRRDRVRVIPNAVDGDGFGPSDSARHRAARESMGVTPDALTALYLGALSPEKNVDVAIVAVGMRDDTTLLIAGDGPERDSLELLARVHAPGRVRFLGRTDDPAVVYSAADVLVLPSRTEGMPAVLIEAGLSELPVVATNVGFVDEIVVDGETGVLVAAGDAVALARGIGHAFADRERMGARAAERCRARFTLGRVTPDWFDVLEGARTRRTG